MPGAATCFPLLLCAPSAVPACPLPARLPASPLLPPLQVCSLVGGLLNVLRLPERWLQPADPSKPAPLDYVLNSHQVGAVLVDPIVQPLQGGSCAAARATNRHACLTAYSPSPCPCCCCLPVDCSSCMCWWPRQCGSCTWGHRPTTAPSVRCWMALRSAQFSPHALPLAGIPTPRSLVCPHQPDIPGLPTLHLH